MMIEKKNLVMLCYPQKLCYYTIKTNLFISKSSKKQNLFKLTCCDPLPGVTALGLFCPAVDVFNIPWAIGCKVPSGRSKQAMSWDGRPIVTGPDRMDAFWNREYGTMRIGLVGSARKGWDCSPAPLGESFGSLGEGGPEVGLSRTFLMTCRVLQ